MTPERWQQVDRLLDEALELPPLERAAFLDQACAGDPALRKDVDAVLEAHGKTSSFLDEPAIAAAAKQMAADQNRSLVGRTLDGHYEVMTLIGAGGMGEVYRARDTRLHREVAIKVLPEHLAQNTEALARFEREARAVATLSHPNILAIHDLGVENGTHYAVMELLEGETLRNRLSRSSLPWREAVEIGAAIADGLAAAHTKGIIHRDLKPENIFLTADGRTKILDFGLAKRKPSLSVRTIGSTPAVTAVTEPWMVLGTVGYMSPEQVRGEEADAPSDIFSLGCVLYEMVAGQRPFARSTSAEIMAAVVRDQPKGLNESGHNLPPELQQLIHRCLNKEPSARYQSARDLFYDLSALLSRSGIFRPIAARPTAAFTRWWKVVTIVAVLLVTLALAYMGVQYWKPLSPPAARHRLVATSNSSASFSPDGTMIAFAQAVDRIPQIWVKSLSAGDPIQITFGDVPAARPKWSPRGDQIVFNRGAAGGQEGTISAVRDLSIWSVPVLGGTARPIIGSGANPNWSGDGSLLVFEKGGEIWTARADGTNQRKVEGIPHTDYPLSDRMPALSPDGAWIAFFHPEAGPLGDFWIISVTGGEPRRLTADNISGTSPTWTPDGNFVVFSSEREGSMTLWRVAFQGGTPEPLTIGAGEDTEPAISRDGKSLRLIYTHTRLSRILTVLNPATKGTRELRQWPNQLAAPRFSPDGSQIAFFSHESAGEIHLSTIDSDGSNLTRRTFARGERNTMPQWSADGKTLYFYQTQPTTSFRKIPLSGGPSVEVVNGWKWENEFAAQVDPTGRFAVYARMRNGLSNATVVHDLESGKEFNLPRALNTPRLSRDGKLIAGVERPLGTRDGDIYICTVDSGACQKLTTGYTPVWSSDASTIYFERSGRALDGAELWTISRQSGKETYIADLRPLYFIGHMFDVSPQGEVVFVRFDSGAHELWLADLSSR